MRTNCDKHGREDVIYVSPDCISDPNGGLIHEVGYHIDGHIAMLAYVSDSYAQQHAITPGIHEYPPSDSDLPSWVDEIRFMCCRCFQEKYGGSLLASSWIPDEEPRAT
jgi:hypothetical protein